MEAVAKLKNIPMSARKMRLVVDLIRGRSVENALNIVRFTNKEASQWCEKVLLSSVANWEQKSDMTLSADDYDLVVKNVFADEGTFLKRFRPAPHGRAHRIRKRTCHITLIVENRVEADIDNASAEEVAQETND